jgi:hypothetical protein
MLQLRQFLHGTLSWSCDQSYWAYWPTSRKQVSPELVIEPLRERLENDVSI